MPHDLLQVPRSNPRVGESLAFSPISPMTLDTRRVINRSPDGRPSRRDVARLRWVGLQQSGKCRRDGDHLVPSVLLTTARDFERSPPPLADDLDCAVDVEASIEGLADPQA